MKFLLVEILVWLIAASVLGLVIGWLFKAYFARRRLSQVSEEWSTRYAELKTVSTQEISNLEERVSSMQTDNSTLQSKVGSLSAMVKSTETALMKANSENKALSTTVSSQKLTIDEIRVESEKLIKKQSEMENELSELESERQREMDELDSASPSNNQDSGKKKPSLDSIVTPISSASGGVVPLLKSSQDSSSNDIDAKIKNLNAERDRLNKEREELYEQEKHFASQLTRGDDTEAYLDQTIRIDDDLTTTIQPDLSELQPTIPQTGSNNAGDRTLDLTNSNDLERNVNRDKPKTLWDKFRASVNKSPSKPEV